MSIQGNATASVGRVKNPFNGVQVFSATMAKDRDSLGARITEWMRKKPGIEIVESVVTQSSDDAFHCLVITLFYNE